MKILFLLLVVICFIWYPYQIRITSVDSNSVSTTDSNGNTQTQKTVVNWDTTFYSSSCSDQSTYNFLQNGNLRINDNCNSANQIINTSWTITQTNYLTLPSTEDFSAGIVLYTLGGSGLISQLDNAEFTFNNQQSTAKIYQSSYGIDHTTILTYDNIITKVYTTFRSK